MLTTADFVKITDARGRKGIQEWARPTPITLAMPTRTAWRLTATPGTPRWHGKPGWRLPAGRAASSTVSRSMEAVLRRFYDAERYRVQKAYREIRKEGRDMGKARPVRRSDGKVYPSIQDAASAMEVSDSSIWQALKKGNKACGYGFEYAEVDKEAPKPGTPKGASGYANKAVYLDMMRKLKRGTCKQCRHYSAGGGQHWCNHGVKRCNTDPGATCPRWEARPQAETLAEMERRQRLEQEAYALKLEKLAEARAKAEQEHAARWAFRSDVLGAQVGFLVCAICKRYGIDPGTGER